MKDLALENMDVLLSPIQTDASVKYFFAFYQALCCRNPTCHRKHQCMQGVDSGKFSGEETEKTMKEILVVHFRSSLSQIWI